MMTKQRLLLVAVTWLASSALAACAVEKSSGFGAAPGNDAGTDVAAGDDAGLGGGDAGAMFTPGDGSSSDAGRPGTVQYPKHDWPTSSAGVVTHGAVPANVATLFSSAPSDSSSPPSLAYPAPDTFFPPNIASILFQWTAASGNAFWIHFAEEGNTLDVYTDGSDPTCAAAMAGTAGCWASSAQDLMLNFGHVADNSGGTGGKVTFTIASLDTTTAGAKKYVSPTYTLNVSRLDISGAIFFWSTTKQGIRRATFDLSDAGTPSPPIDYITPKAFPPSTELDAGDPLRCMGCHTVSRDGTKLATSFLNELAIIDVVPVVPAPITLGPSYKGQPATTTQMQTTDAPGMWSTFNPDASSVVTVSGATMTVRSTKSGLPTGSITTPSKTAGTMPDWSPTDDHLAYTEVPMDTANNGGQDYRHCYGSSIAMLDVQGGMFNNHQIVAQSTKACPSDNLLYTGAATTESYANPFFSQDGKWLVYSRGDCESEADLSSEIIVSPVMPSAPQDHLVALNQQTAAGAVTGIENGMPIIGPLPPNLPASDPNRNFVWVAFTSVRNYGLVLSPTSKVNQGAPNNFPSTLVKQIWIAAVDLNKLASGVTAVDPSYPAFRFPGQDLAENTHRPFWTADALKGVPIVIQVQ
jgi:hypothetical protein